MYDENSNTSSVAAPTQMTSASVAQPSNTLVSQLLNVKDSRWLQVEVCREFQRGQCARSDQECKFAHPPPHVDVQQGRVTACYDSIKGRCTRENPKCKYLHPPQHIKDQLLINGRNNLALKNLLCSQLNQTAAGQPIAAAVNPIAQLMAQQQQNLAAASMVPTLPYPYYQGLVYSPLLNDPYQQQLQSTLLQPAAGLAGFAGLGQLAQQAAPMLPGSLQHAVLVGSRKRALEEDTSDHAPNTIYNLAAAAAAAGVPCKRPAVDKGNATVVFNPQTAAQQQFNPYLLQGLQGYVPAVSFNGQAGGMPPRF